MALFRREWRVFLSSVFQSATVSLVLLLILWFLLKLFKESCTFKVVWPITYLTLYSCHIISNKSWESSLTCQDGWAVYGDALRLHSPLEAWVQILLLMLLLGCQWSGSFLLRLAHLGMNIYSQTFQASPPPLKPHLSFNSSRSWPPVHWWRKLEGARSHSNSVDLVMRSAIQSLWSGTMLALPHLWQSNRGHWHSCAAGEPPVRPEGLVHPPSTEECHWDSERYKLWWAFYVEHRHAVIKQ